MTLLGFSAGIPLYLIFSSLSLWLDQIGIAKSSITIFSWAALGYSFKFLWSPLVDTLPLYYLSNKFGQRRGWLLFTQLLIICAIVWMALTNPALGQSQLVIMAMAAVLLGLSSATQDILIDAWRIEASDKKDIAILSSLYIIGYRIGMIVSGAGTLFLAHYFGASIKSYNYHAWQYSYLIMALFMLVGVLTTLFIKEPKPVEKTLIHTKNDYLAVLLVFMVVVSGFILSYQFTSAFKKYLIDSVLNFIPALSFVEGAYAFLQFLIAIFLSFFAGKQIYKLNFINKQMIADVYIKPFSDLYLRHRKNMGIIIGIISLYRISDIVMGVSANLFYQSMGFELDEIAKIVKTFGLVMTLSGGLLGGLLVVKFGVVRIMLLGAVLSSVTNLLFMYMAQTGKSVAFLVVLISADNLSAGLAMAAFIGFLSLLVNRSYTAVQYAIFSSVMTLFPKIIGGFSGSFVDAYGFSNFFLMSALIGVPVVVLLTISLKNEVFRFDES